MRLLLQHRLRCGFDEPRHPEDPGGGEQVRRSCVYTVSKTLSISALDETQKLKQKTTKNVAYLLISF